MKKQKTKKGLKTELNEDSLMRRHQTSVKTAISDDYSGENSFIFRFNKGIQEFSSDKHIYRPAITKGRQRNRIDIIPFKVTEDWYPNLRTKNGQKIGVSVGDIDYKIEVPCHRFWSKEGGTKIFLCMKNAFGKPCFACRERELLDDPDQKKQLNVTWRVLYNVIDRNLEKKKLQLFEISYHLFTKSMEEESELENGEAIPFSSLKHGKTIVFKGKENEFSKMNKSKNAKKVTVECYDFNFEDRKPYSADILQKAYPLDKMVVIPEQAELKKAYLGGEYMEEEEEEQTKKKKKSKKEKPEKEDDNIGDDDFIDEDEGDEDDDEDDEIEEEEEEEETDDDDDDDDEIEEEDDDDDIPF